MRPPRHKTIPTLVLLPGLDGTGDLFQPVIAALGSDFAFRVVRYPNRALGYAALEEFARLALPKRPFILLGESFSGPIAVGLAAKQPAGLMGVILSGTFVRNPRPACAALRPFIDLLSIQTIPFQALSYLLLGGHATTYLRSALAAALTQVAAGALRSRLKAVLSVDVSAKLRAIHVPLLYLLAAQDRVVPPSAAQAILEVRPDMRVISISASHLLLQTAPRTAANAINAFAREIRNLHRSA